MRTFPDEKPPYDEFFWDAIGTGIPAISKVAITAKVPGGAQDSSCFAGPAGSTQTCDVDKIDKDGTAVFGEN